MGALRRKLLTQVGEKVLGTAEWLSNMPQEEILKGLPTPHLGKQRLTKKTSTPLPVLGARPLSKPADWPRGAQSRGTAMVKKRPAVESAKQGPPLKKSRAEGDA